jgi:hypothetical protein
MAFQRAANEESTDAQTPDRTTKLARTNRRWTRLRRHADAQYSELRSFGQFQTRCHIQSYLWTSFADVARSGTYGPTHSYYASFQKKLDHL